MSQANVSIAIQWTPEADHPPFSEVDNARIRRWAKACFTERAEITLRLVGINEARALNLQYRGKDYATNVLTFPYEAPESIIGQSDIAAMPTFMADVVICPEVVMREAQEQHKDPIAHFAHLVVHGCLHAQGYVHEHDQEAQAMENKEIEILKRFKIANPYPTEANASSLNTQQHTKEQHQTTKKQKPKGLN